VPKAESRHENNNVPIDPFAWVFGHSKPQTGQEPGLGDAGGGAYRVPSIHWLRGVGRRRLAVQRSFAGERERR